MCSLGAFSSGSLLLGIFVSCVLCASSPSARSSRASSSLVFSTRLRLRRALLGPLLLELLEFLGPLRLRCALNSLGFGWLCSGPFWFACTTPALAFGSHILGLFSYLLFGLFGSCVLRAPSPSARSLRRLRLLCSLHAFALGSLCLGSFRSLFLRLTGLRVLRWPSHPAL